MKKKQIYSNSDIDIVVLWVDDSDQKWQDQRKQYIGMEDKSLNPNDCRFRDWGLMRYWFRAVEIYAPWVRKIHFVTCGHYPEWLNLKHPKLHFVKHEDFIPKKYLPTFSSRPIELNLHRIDGLSEKFVYFNDDMFLVAPVKPADFFKGDLPRDEANRVSLPLTNYGHIQLNQILIINREFSFVRQFRKNLLKWINYRYPLFGIRNLFYPINLDFTGVEYTHIANSYLKSTFNEVWNKYRDELDNTCQHKFRQLSDVNQLLFRYWQIVAGDFFPRRHNFGCRYSINNIGRIKQDLTKKKHKIICLNDPDDMVDNTELKERVIQLFQEFFQKESSFENK